MMALDRLTAPLKVGGSPMATPAKIPTHTSKAPKAAIARSLSSSFIEQPNRGGAGTMRLARR